MPEKEQALDDIAELIQSCFVEQGRVQCGLIYCLTIRDCENAANKLQQHFSRDMMPQLKIRCVTGRGGGLQVGGTNVQGPPALHLGTTKHFSWLLR
jgi:hypothetical protein